MRRELLPLQSGDKQMKYGGNGEKPLTQVHADTHVRWEAHTRTRQHKWNDDTSCQ